MLAFKSKSTPVVSSEPEPKTISGEALEQALNDIKSGYTEEEWGQMWDELDEMYPDDPEVED